jgi:hypothetical protein
LDALSGGVRLERERGREGEGLGCAEWRRSAREREGGRERDSDALSRGVRPEREREGGRGTRMR